MRIGLRDYLVSLCEFVTRHFISKLRGVDGRVSRASCVTSGIWAPLGPVLLVASSLSPGDDYNYYSDRPIIICRAS